MRLLLPGEKEKGIKAFLPGALESGAFCQGKEHKSEAEHSSYFSDVAMKNLIHVAKLQSLPLA